MIHRFLLGIFLFALTASLAMSAQPRQLDYDNAGENWNWDLYSEEGSGSSFLGVDIADITAERLSALKLKEEHGAEIIMVDQDAPAGKAGLHEHDVVLSLNGTAIDSAAQLRRIIKETPPGRVIALGISRDGQPMTIKVQLADRRKSMAWEPKMPDMPKPPVMPTMPDFDFPVSVVVVHSSARSGLMVENITGQLGDFFGVKDGKGVLVRSVEKGSRGEKAGFHAGDVVVKVNNQPVHDTSDFTHALRSTDASTVSVTVMRDKREQNLTLTLPDKKDSGSLLEDTLNIPEISAETEQALNRAGNEIARISPAIAEKMQKQAELYREDAEKRQHERELRLRELEQRLQERQEKFRHEFSREWTEI
ncbi:MAG TPA: PDZ domain-containing protein [Terriglobales bacterium]|jgi:serine protease Do|nr:PDZ domain-containing protein [Terriglobales bacterium]